MILNMLKYLDNSSNGTSSSIASTTTSSTTASLSSTNQTMLAPRKKSNEIDIRYISDLSSASDIQKHPYQKQKDEKKKLASRKGKLDNGKVFSINFCI